jgi:hypothetical protein
MNTPKWYTVPVTIACLSVLAIIALMFLGAW